MSDCGCGEEGYCDYHFELERQQYAYLKFVPAVFVMSERWLKERERQNERD